MVHLEKYDRKSPIELREQIAAKVTRQHPQNAVVVQTCNRVEIYSGQGSVTPETANHLFRVVSGLESGLPGETSIQGQVKNSYLKAHASTQLSSSLHKLFQTALKVGKKVRSQTGISRGAMSHSQAPVQLLQKMKQTFKKCNNTILGVHNLSEPIIQHLNRQGVQSIFIGNRTFDKADALAKKYGAWAFDFSILSERLKQTDVLICATSAPHLIIRKEQFPEGKPMLIFDLAVPRDIDPEIGKIQHIQLMNVQNVEDSIEENISKRKD